MPDDNRKPERQEIDPAQIEKLLEIELMQKRATWQQTKARRGGLRALSFLFLFLVILAALVGFFVFFSSGRMSELKSSEPAPSQPTSAP